MNNIRVIRASKLVDLINLEQNNEKYNLAKVFIDLDNSVISDYLDLKRIFIQVSIKVTTNVKDFNTFD